MAKELAFDCGDASAKSLDNVKNILPAFGNLLD
jgi:hypothetical protein